MKKKDIVTIVGRGFLSATAHCLPAEQFYKWHRFRKCVSTAFQDLVAQEKDLMQECNIDPRGNNKKKDEERYNKVYAAILDEEARLELPDKIPFEYYKLVYDENRTDKGDVFASFDIEDVMLENLFTQPE
jgi:hypothetical protein